jgi:membrane-associated phospholipid phosphatase
MSIKALTLLLLMISAAVAHGGDRAALCPAPYSITLKNDLWLGGAGIAAAGAAFVLERSIPALRQEEIDGLLRGSVNPFDRHATYHYSPTIDNISDFLNYCILAAPLALLTDKDIRRTTAEFSVMYAEVVAFSYALPTLGKTLVKRPRPFTYNPDAPAEQKLLADARASFFSRHTTFAFASACFMSTVYGTYNPGSKLRPYLWAGSLTAAAVVGDLRFEAGAHFLTDVITGALVGSVIGLGVPYLHKSKNTGARVSLYPSSNGLCMSVEW